MTAVERGGPRRRNQAVAMVVALMVAAGLVADRTSPDAEIAEIAAEQLVMPSASAPSALSSTWYCPVGVAVPVGARAGEVVLANPTERDVTATVTVRRGDGEEVSEVVVVPALGEVRQGVRQLLEAQVAAVRVDVDGGGLAVEHSVTGTGGRTVGPCSPGASSEWHLAAGVTLKGATEALALYNPFPDPAIVDMSFVTDDGFVAPPGLAGFVVDGRSVKLVDVGAHVRREAHLSGSIVARTGRLVVERLQVFDGTRQQEGVALTLAAPVPALEWTFPDGQVGEGITERVHVYNPGEREASVDIGLHLKQGFAEPFVLAVPPGGYSTVDVGADGRVPPGVAHAMVVQSVNGVGVVVEREIVATEGSTRRGVTYLMGARRSAQRWVAADGRTAADVDEWIVVFNPSERPVTLALGALVGGQVLPVADLQDVEVDGLSRRAIRVGDHITRDPLPLLVRASGPVVVERDLYAADAVGMSAAIAIPLED